MWITTFVLFSFFTVFTVVISQDDPCLEGNYIELNQWERSVANDIRKGICDNFLPSGWYRPISLAGNTMPTECIQGGFRCGTTSTLWMNGSYPSVGEVSNVTACASNYNGGCCISSYDIQVKNCGDYYVYNLTHTHGCYEAYCFGTETKCPKGETSDNGGFTPGCEFDPCQSVNYKVLRMEVKRSSNYSLNDYDTAIDDSRLITGWYRIDSVTGNDIVNQSVSMMHCGTVYPLWMQGNIPEIGDKTVDRWVCKSGLSSMCEAQYDIKVRNCGNYRTYFLQQLNEDKSSYCFGTLPVPTPPTTIKPPDRDSTDKEDGERSNSSVWAVVCILPVISVLLVIIVVLQICKKNTKQDRSVDFVPEKAKTKYAVNSAPPAYEETMQNEKNSNIYDERMYNHGQFDTVGGILPNDVGSRPNYIEARPPQSTKMK
ncbi:uncharacterized protein [Mytilus edulis]|uniref:uncharacterized protein n=1 Tax=Mytilus edulis TaxID=6550 RepID=UPI0039EF15A7